MPALLLMCEHTMVLKSGLAQTRYKTRSGYITCCHASPFPVQQPRVLSLSSRFELFCDGLRVCDDCTSFRVHGKFLLVTTHRHTLRCLLLDFDLANLLEGGASSVSFNDAPRELERGSLLVTSVLADGRVVLQLPRGNLETISPRTLVLDKICDHLDRNAYGRAFALMKVHRINLNLLCDHNVQAFLDNLPKFVHEIGDTTSLNLFIAELTDQDTSCTMYASAYRLHTKKTSHILGSKTDHICDTLRAVLEQLDYDK